MAQTEYKKLYEILPNKDYTDLVITEHKATFTRGKDKFEIVLEEWDR